MLLVVAHAVTAQEPITPPADGADVVSFDDGDQFAVNNSQNAESTSQWVAAKDKSFERAFQVDIVSPSKTAEGVELKIPIEKGFQKGDAMLLSFWIRRPRSGGQPGPATVVVDPGNGKAKTYRYDFSAYRNWQQYARKFKAPADFKPEKACIRFYLGDAGPAIDIGDFRLIDYGAEYDYDKIPESRVTYHGREPEALWRKEALERIEKIRKSGLKIEVVDKDGKPASGAQVQVQMQRNAFEFGTAVNAHLIGGNENQFPYTKTRSGNKKTASWEDAQKYRDVLKNYFSCATFESELRPHNWQSQFAKKPAGDSRYKLLTQQAVPWLQANDIGIRGHYIAWGAIDFNAAEKKFVGKPEAHRKWLWALMDDVFSKTNDFVTEWDTINHIVAWGKHTYEIEYGGLDIYVDVMNEARRLAPNATHAINEGKVLPNGYKREPYKRVIRYLNDHGQAPDAVGFMAHFGLTSLTPPEELLEVYDDFAKISPRMQLTELDVEAGDDEQLQADYFRDVMIASFSHPNFVGIIQWGFWEEGHWKPAAALWRKDWSLKPAGKVYIDLVRDQWWTDEELKTDANGVCALRGFHGEYKISVLHEGKTVVKTITLEPDGKSIQVQVN